MNEYMPFVTQFLNNFLPYVLPVFATFLAAVCIQWLRLLQAKIKETNPDLFEKLQWFAQVAVLAAEQAGAAEIIADKKAYAVKIVQDLLTKYGFGAVDVTIIEAAIEAAVFEEINKPVTE